MVSKHKSTETDLANLLSTEGAKIRTMSLLLTFSSTLWIGQAALVAFLVAELLAKQGAVATIWITAGIFFLIGVIRSTLNAIAERNLTRVADRIIGNHRLNILTQQQQVSPYDPKAPSSAATAALLIEKLAVLTPFITQYTPAKLKVTVLPLIILVVAFSMSWAVGLTLLVAGPLIPVFMALVGMAAEEAAEKQMDEISSMNSLLIERLGALVDVKLLNAQSSIAQQFQSGAERLRERTMSVLRIAFLSSTVLELFSALGVAMVAVYVGFALLGELPYGAYASPLTPFEGIFLLLLAPEFFQPLREMAAAWHDRAGALAVAKDISDLRDRDDQRNMIVADEAVQNIDVQGNVSWSDLVFAGPPEFGVPDGHVPAREAVALTGPSGSGKSTLIAALGGLLSPISGTVQIDNETIGPHNLQSLRGAMAWLPQETRFFTGSLEDNLTLGAKTSGSIDEALKLSSALQIVDRLPNGLEAKLSENGAGVSGGEARRLILARAALRDARIILADEPTADLDDDTAKQVIAGLMTLRDKGATLIAATHDPRLIRVMDREIKL